MSYIGNIPTTAAFVTDTFSANGSGTVFTLSVAPANTSSILVAVSGVLQDPSTYSVAATTLTFSAAPPAGTGNISVRFLGIPASGVTTTAYRTVTEFTATAGQTTFTPPSYTAGYISVYRNGVMLGSADYTASNGTTVVLATGATAGDLITTESFYVSSVVGAIPATAGAVTDSYILSAGSNKITGTTTNNNAAVGYIGEFVSSLVQNVTVVASGTGTNLTSISLTAGDWDITGVLTLYGSGNRSFGISISTTSGVFNSGSRGLNFTWGAGDTTAGVGSVSIPRIRASLSSTTTYYLNGIGSVSTDTYDGYITARRVR
jgi:hypothetical protein